jgi:hypothetical protein
VTGAFPAAGFRGWLQLDSETEAARNYVLYFDPPDQPVGGPPVAFTIREWYPAADLRSVYVQTATGLHEVLSSPPSPELVALAALDDPGFSTMARSSPPAMERRLVWSLLIIVGDDRSGRSVQVREGR